MGKLIGVDDKLTAMLRVVLVAGLVGCAGIAHPVAPEAGWTELRSPHFTVWTHGDPESGALLVREMEHLRSVVLGVAFPKLPDPGRTLVIAFRDADEVAGFLPKQFAAEAFHGTPLFQPVIVVAADAIDRDERILTHEMTHAISYRALRVQPRWFAEGLASFFETVRLDPDRATVDVGAPYDWRVRQIRRGQLDTVETAFACDRVACETSDFYATTWAMFTYLINERPAQLARYEETLAGLAPGAPPPALADVVPELRAAALQHDISEWLMHGRHNVWHYTIQLRTWPIATRPMAAAEGHAARAVVRVSLDRGHSEELAATLALDPTNLVATLMKAARDRAIDPATARAVATAHPDDWRAWWLVGMAVRVGDEARDARAKLCALAAADPDAVPPTGLCGSR